MDDISLLQELNLTAGSHTGDPIMINTSNLTLPRQASAGLANLWGFPEFASLTGREIGSPAPTHQMFPTTLRTLHTYYMYVIKSYACIFSIRNNSCSSKCYFLDHWELLIGSFS